LLTYGTLNPLDRGSRA